MVYLNEFQCRTCPCCYTILISSVMKLIMASVPYSHIHQHRFLCQLEFLVQTVLCIAFVMGLKLPVTERAHGFIRQKDFQRTACFIVFVIRRRNFPVHPATHDSASQAPHTNHVSQIRMTYVSSQFRPYCGIRTVCTGRISLYGIVGYLFPVCSYIYIERRFPQGGFFCHGRLSQPHTHQLPYGRYIPAQFCLVQIAVAVQITVTYQHDNRIVGLSANRSGFLQTSIFPQYKTG